MQCVRADGGRVRRVGAEKNEGRRPPPPPPPPSQPLSPPVHSQPTVAVTRPPGASVVATPAPGDTVTVRVLRTSSRAAGVEILCIEGSGATTADAAPTTTPLRYPPPGVIRAADVRATAVDSVVVGACFRPGDLVRAAVLSTGDGRAYYLTTVGDVLGVVSARSASHPDRPFLVPGPDGQGMACPLTSVLEPRKVARQ